MNAPASSPSERHGALRAAEAAANRAGEAARVLEDIARFMLNDPHLTQQFKDLRHRMHSLRQRLTGEQGVRMRDTRGDVGTGLSTPQEHQRQGTEALIGANASRLQQALRSLEEMAKLLDPQAAPQWEQLRYAAYTLHKAMQITWQAQQRLRAARVYVLLDGRETAQAMERLAAALVEAGADVIQLRDKRLPDRELADRGRRLRRITAGTRTLFIFNDRPDLALLCRADGVHVGQEELSVAQVRHVVGPQPLVGVSTHSLAQAQQAVLDGADYIGVGPVFPSQTKQFDRFVGPELLRQVAQSVNLPRFAIGGITRENLPQVIAAGFDRVALGQAVLGAENPAAEVRWFKRQLEQAAAAAGEQAAGG